MRSVVAMDMAHRKPPHSCGLVVYAVGFDANDNVHVKAIAHVPTEDGAQWTWFMEQFKAAYPTLTSKADFVTLSDQDKVSRLATSLN